MKCKISWKSFGNEGRRQESWRYFSRWAICHLRLYQRWHQIQAKVGSKFNYQLQTKLIHVAKELFCQHNQWLSLWESQKSCLSKEFEKHRKLQHCSTEATDAHAQSTKQCGGWYSSVVLVLISLSIVLRLPELIPVSSPWHCSGECFSRW